MSFSWKDLKALSDKELVEGHDREAQNTVFSTNYYLAELRHRDQRRIAECQQRTAEEVKRLTERVARLTIVILVLTAANVVAAVILALR